MSGVGIAHARMGRSTELGILTTRADQLHVSAVLLACATGTKVLHGSLDRFIATQAGEVQGSRIEVRLVSWGMEYRTRCSYHTSGASRESKCYVIG